MHRSLRPPPADLAIAAILLVAGVVEAVVVQTTRPALVHAAVSGTVAVAIAWRRRVPVAVLVLALLGMFAIEGPNAPFVVFAAMVVAAYSVGAWSEGLRRLVGLFVALAPLLGLVAEGGEPADLVAVTVLYGGAWSVGRIVAGHRQQAEYLSDQAEALQRAEPERRAAAAAEERARIGRELHDIVSHSISVIAVQTQAVRRRLGPEQERERDDLRAVETTARQAMVEMRRLFGVLRSNGEDPPLAPQPGLDQLQRLVDRSRIAGLEVELRETGERMHLPPGVDLAAYRIIQESLTNVLKHSAAAAVRVTVAYDDHAIDLRVEDTGAGGQPSGAGQGLIGMRERVSLYGGSFAAGPREGGGFAVRATLPLHEREQP